MRYLMTTLLIALLSFVVIMLILVYSSIINIITFFISTTIPLLAYGIIPMTADAIKRRK